MDGDCSTGTALESWVYVYDGDGVRVSTAHFTGSNTEPDSTTHYFFGGALETSGGAVKKYYSFAGQMGVGEITGCSPYGASTITGGQGERMPSENELAGARFQGAHVARIAKKLKG